MIPPTGGSEARARLGSRRAAAARRRRLVRWTIGVGMFVCFTLTLVALHHLDRNQSRPAVRSVTAKPAPGGPAPTSTSKSNRLVYPYSIVPGGVRSSQDVAQAMQVDPVVAEHYINVRPADLHEEQIIEPRLVHASYRIGDKVFWTKRKLALRPGERILTDGKTTIRERCGNILTVEALEPSLMDEPAVPEFEAAVDPFSIPAGQGLTLGMPPDSPGDPGETGAPGATGGTSGSPGGSSTPTGGLGPLSDPVLPVPEPGTWMLVGVGLTVALIKYATRNRAS